MIDYSEELIMANWRKNDGIPMVSIFNIVYNHEEYLERCLDGFLSQKTNFCFEILVHDDASTDKSGEIIKKYTNKYPNIVKPIIQCKNQFSQGISIRNDILFPKAQGKYIALCEGDDYWNDDNKLQLQYDYMESHPECSMCVHNSYIHDLKSGSNRLFNKWNDEKYLSPEDIIIGWSVHTSSYFMLHDIAFTPVEMRYWFGDYVMLTMASLYGLIGYIPKTMSVYNYNNRAGITYKNCSSISWVISKETERIEYLEKFDYVSKGLYHDVIEGNIKKRKFDLLLFQYDICETKDDYMRIRNEIKSQRNLITTCSTKTKLKFFITSLNYFTYKFYFSLRKKIKQK